MVGPDGTRYPNESRIEALTPGELIRVRHVNAPPFTLEIRLSPQDGGTLVTWTQAFDDPDLAQSLARIDSGEYGFCDETGEPIGLGRLLARPTATLSLEAQQRREMKQKMFGD